VSSSLSTVEYPSHLYDHDAPLRRVSVLLFFIVVRIRTTAFVARGNFETRLLLAPPLLFLAATDLFDDPRFEHGGENL
jgi:hypothetical protein